MCVCAGDIAETLLEVTRNATLMAEICREEVPKLCSRMLISRDTRPCSTQGKHFVITTRCMPTRNVYALHGCAFMLVGCYTFLERRFAESYLSSGQDLTIEYMPNSLGANQVYGTTAASFKLRYEFLDTALGGAPIERYPANSGHKTMPEPAALLQFQSKSCDRVYRCVSIVICAENNASLLRYSHIFYINMFY